MPRDDLISVKEAAHLVDVTQKTIYKMIESGELTAYRIGIGRGRFRIPRIELLREFGTPTLLAAIDAGDDDAVNEVIEYWFHVCATADPMTVLRWMAENAIKFWASHPELPRLPGLYVRNRVA